MEKIVAIASDHAGYNLKKEIVEHLEKMGYRVKDFGTDSENPVDYPDYGHLLARAIDKGEYETGITLCGSGNGINMVTNKYRKIRGALCWNLEIAVLARRHNDANVCSLPARFISLKEAKEIVDAFLNTGFDGGRHERRINKIPSEG